MIWLSPAEKARNHIYEDRLCSRSTKIEIFKSWYNFDRLSEISILHDI